MKKLFSVLMIACLSVIVSCKPNTEEKTSKTDSDSIVKVDSLVKTTLSVDSLVKDSVLKPMPVKK